MGNLKLILQLYFRPASAMSDIMDKGSWLFAAGAVLVVSIGFLGTINTRLESAYHIPNVNEFQQQDVDEDTSSKHAASAYTEAMTKRRTIPLVGDRFFRFFYFEPGKFYQPFLLLSVFYVPAAILLMCLFSGVCTF